MEPSAVGEAVSGALKRAGSCRVVVPADLPDDWVPGVHDDQVPDDQVLIDGLLEHPGTGPNEIAVERDRATLDASELGTFDAVVSGCALAIAETGTIVLDGGVRQGRRALSLVPDHLVVIVFEGQVVGGVPDAVARLDPRSPQTWISARRPRAISSSTGSKECTGRAVLTSCSCPGENKLDREMMGAPLSLARQ